MTAVRRAMRRIARQERGSLAVELVILAPVMLLVLGLAIFAGKVVTAGQAVEQAASAAARTASISRTAGGAQASAETAARDTLTQQGMDCVTTTVSVDTSGFNNPVGTAATVSAAVTCVVNTSSLAPGIPGSRTVTATSASPLDTFRGRT